MSACCLKEKLGLAGPDLILLARDLTVEGPADPYLRNESFLG